MSVDFSDLDDFEREEVKIPKGSVGAPALSGDYLQDAARLATEKVPCPRCRGKGVLPWRGRPPCHSCNGTGRVEQDQARRIIAIEIARQQERDRKRSAPAPAPQSDLWGPK